MILTDQIIKQLSENYSEQQLLAALQLLRENRQRRAGDLTDGKEANKKRILKG